ncbi:ATP-dependent DNA ligase [Thalassobacter stenotrophicus]|uniref:ATP-dependent DNA ligase n=1 Tax=Thalassobacter TaxID=266808 RepID=UPI00051D8D9B|nr:MULTISPECIES: ATP-dependent DNA ligase [Thalassobacter]KGK80046.1 ATP-dependent DNA ligase [Thalassobacter stenotrophicus]KGL02454.1 ATP-dependent DNA ligase [Thalassobacter sp. 16PALIMAR09]
MRDFADLFTALDSTTSTKAKTEALAGYLSAAASADRLWCVALLSGRRPKRTVTATRLREWAAERAGLPLWLFEESYSVVGDLAETIGLVLPSASQSDDRPLSDWIKAIQALQTQDDTAKKPAILTAWDTLDGAERFVFNKLLTGGFRVGVSQKLMTRALALATAQDEAALAHRLMGGWTPDTTTWEALIEAPAPQADLSRPYPFQLAYGLEHPPQDLGPPENWLVEHKWDGIRAQLIRRGGQMFIWSRGEELMTNRFPDLAPVLDHVPDGTVIDGELLAWDFAADQPLPFAALQKRIGRKTVPKTVLRDAPVVLRAYDVLEFEGADLRGDTLRHRRKYLNFINTIPDDIPLRLSRGLEGTWEDHVATRAAARDAQAEGLMIKRLDAPYVGGRRKGDWWKWKLDPLTVDAVMIYAQAGHGRRANLYTDYTFACWKGNELVPFTKAYSGLTDAEFRDITKWVRKNTLERFGPVRRVPPELVFEIAFEGIQASSRHKSGLALRFPRMARWRRDKPAAEANTHADLLEMLDQYG